jgi:hypothetical protein
MPEDLPRVNRGSVLPFPVGRSCRKMKMMKKLGREASPRSP